MGLGGTSLVLVALAGVLTAACGSATDAPGSTKPMGAAGVGGTPEGELTPDPPPAGGGAAGAAGQAGAAGAGGSAGPICGDGACEWDEDVCACPSDCGPCNTAGSAGSGGSGGSGGASSGGASGGGASGGGGTSGGAAKTPGQQAIARAESGVGFSYWWGHGRYLPEGPSASNAGSCSGSCPNCTHSGSYGGDCSGYVAKAWQVPSTNTDLTKDSHPYSTADFNEDASQWSTIPQGSLAAGDAMVYRSGGAGHIFLFAKGDPWGSMYAYECKGCSAGCTKGYRTVSSAYHAIRRTGY